MANTHSSQRPSAETLPAEAPSNLKTDDHLPITKDFGFLPIPQSLRYDPGKPAHFGLVLNVTFGLASTFMVANLYYCQPLLIKFSDSFGVSYDAVSRIPTLAQAGYAVGILTISTLGDLVRRRPLILILVFITASLTIGLAVTSSLAVFEALCFLIGMTTVVPQIMIPLAADLAPPERRASAISIVLAGLLLGILIARVIAGIIAQFTTWRVVYYLAIGVQYAVLLMLYAVVPDYPAKNKGMSYFQILWSMAKFAVTEPMLIQAYLVNGPSSACFTNFWITLTFLLGDAPYHYSTLVIGLFGLVGMVGVAMAPLVGRAIDKLVPWFAGVLGVLALLVFQGIGVAADGISIGAVIVMCIGLDIFRQLVQVSLTSKVFGLDPNARARLNAVLLLSLFIGQLVGTSVGTDVFTKYGWRPAAALSLAWTGWMMLIMLIRGPHVSRYTWFGYEGGIEVRKSKLEESERKKRDVEVAAVAETGSHRDVDVEQGARRSMEEGKKQSLENEPEKLMDSELEGELEERVGIEAVNDNHQDP